MIRYELADALDARYRFPASISPQQVSVGGEPRARFVRAFGSDNWFTVLDGIREPQPFTLTGVLATDRDSAAIHDDLAELEAAVATAARLFQVDAAGDVAYLELRGALPVTVEPDGVDGTLLTLQIHLLPAEDDWRMADE